MKQKDKPLTKKQEQFIKELVDNPKLSPTKAAMRAYGSPDKPVTYGSAKQIAMDNMHKPAIVSRLGDYNNLVESMLVDTVRQWGADEAPRKREIALDAAKFIHDKTHGRATQKIETQQNIVSISIDLTKPSEPVESP